MISILLSPLFTASVLANHEIKISVEDPGGSQGANLYIKFF